MSKKDREIANSICEHLKKADEKQKAFIKGFAEGMAIARELNENDTQNREEE